MADFFELLKKYSSSETRGGSRGLRYTSFPAVPYWSKSPSESEWIEALSTEFERSQKKGLSGSLYIHIPFCESMCTYCGCNTRVNRSATASTRYIQTLLKEWKLYGSLLGQKIEIEQIYLGGGTPTYLTPPELETLIHGIFSEPFVSKTREVSFSVEADPRVTSSAHLSSLSRLGFRFLNLGVEDFAPSVQHLIQRVQTEDQVKKVVEAAREEGFTSIGFDLIHGFPLQNEGTLRENFEAVGRIKPDRISFYSYVHVPWIKTGQRLFSEIDLPSWNEKTQLYLMGRKWIKDLGYVEVGMDHFVLESDPLASSLRLGTLYRNFMGYTAHRVSPLIGLGVSAMGDAWGALVQNEKQLETYQSRIEKGELPLLRGHLLSEQDLKVREQISNLTTHFETQWSEASMGSDRHKMLLQRLQPLADDLLVQISETSLSVSMCKILDRGKPFLKNICMAFDPYLS